MITITIEAKNPKDLQDQLQQLVGSPAQGDTTPPRKPANPKKKPATKKAKPPEKTEEPDIMGEVEAPTPAQTLEAAKKFLQANAKKNKPVVMGYLDEVGVDKVSDLDEAGRIRLMEVIGG